ncbi:MAG TPA: choice-of-anchor Q domain-containing protein [Verrucomicrobiae bacterium]|nr:choice-of-anchor Q domain-containing protein [Verrucomicrobiae bacterium]
MKTTTSSFGLILKTVATLFIFTIAGSGDRLLATTYTVNSAADNGAGAGTSGDLRYCLAHVADGDGVTFSLPNPTTITLTQGEILVQNSVTLTGPGTGNLFINGTGGHRIFTLATGGSTNLTINISGLTFTNGASGSIGGALLIQSGSPFTVTVNLSNCVFVANLAQFGGAIDSDGILNIHDCILAENTSGSQGGVLYNFGAGIATIDHSTLANNEVNGDGGAIWNNHTLNITASTLSGNAATGDGGAIESTNGTVTIVNSTISSNLATGSGGAIVNGGTLDVDATTIAFNHANDAGGVESLLSASLASVINTIIASNTATTADADVKGVFDSQGDNLIGNTNGATGWIGGDLVNVDAKLGPLQDNGGATFTHLLLTNSPALDAGDDANRQVTDQRDVSRPQGKGTDIGAVETSLCEIDTNTPPISIACSSNLTVIATFVGGATVTFAVTAVDNCDTDTPVVVSFPASGNVFAFGTNTVNSAATNGLGGQIGCSFTIFVEGSRNVLQDQLQQLTALFNAAPTGPNAKGLAKAIVALTKGVDALNWATDEDPNSKTGKAVFSAAARAVSSLLALQKKNGPDAALQGIIDQTIASTRLAAVISIQSFLGGSAKDLAKAQAALSSGDAATKPVTAIHDYAHAWHSASL